jgi:uncharacterized membrane protein
MSDETPTTRRAANLFDLRRIIGGLFLVYGLVLFLLGLFASDEDIEKAAGWNVNLWTGVGMLAFGALMMLWAFTRPLGDELVEGGEHAERSAPRGVDAAALASDQRRRGARRDRERAGEDGDARR